MNIANAYSVWAASYDADRNLTRDLDALVTRQVIGGRPLQVIVEAGCGTGKNTRYFAQMAQQVQALDFSPGMLEVARRQLAATPVDFQLADLCATWPCPSGHADLVSFNLVLEHIEDLVPVFGESCRVLRPGGRLFVSELHPYKQYQNSQARFAGPDGQEVRVQAYPHNISDYLCAAAACGVGLVQLQEWWHAEDPRSGVPRLVSFVFERPLDDPAKATATATTFARSV